ncbi:hypothetical protein J2Z19_002019 [Ensifer adhaerens]|uniref:Uncharacterized protein n=1 Tax=Ensifer adhaerens TaxID=106592 RepID=A0ACC5STW1_ENSAD|nr:hypothetical protein [Ensifer adhaerens]
MKSIKRCVDGAAASSTPKFAKLISSTKLSPKQCAHRKATIASVEKAIVVDRLAAHQRQSPRRMQKGEGIKDIQLKGRLMHFLDASSACSA